MNLFAHPHRLVAGGALGIAVTTAAEVLTAPYSPHVSLFGLNPAVHAVKVLAAIAFVLGMCALATRHRAALGPVGVGAAAALAAGTTFGAVPYSVVETTLDPGLSPVEAAAWLEAAYGSRLAWVGYLAAAGLLLVLVGLVTLAVVALRRRTLPRWRPLLALAAIPAGVLSGVLSETTGLPVPHPPAWVFLCIGIAYAAPFVTVPSTRTPRGVPAAAAAG